MDLLLMKLALRTTAAVAEVMTKEEMDRIQQGKWFPPQDEHEKFLLEVASIMDDGSPVVKSAHTAKTDLSRFKKVYTFGEHESESFILWCECDMFNVELSIIEGNNQYSQPIFKTPQIKKDEALELRVTVPEANPMLSFSYIARGAKHRFELVYNKNKEEISFLIPLNS